MQEYERLDKRGSRAASASTRAIRAPTRRDRRRDPPTHPSVCSLRHADQTVAGGRRGAGDAAVEREGFRVVRRGRGDGGGGGDSRRSSAFSSGAPPRIGKGLAGPVWPARVRGAHRRRAAVRQPAELPGMLRDMEKQGLDVGAQVRRREHSAAALRRHRARPTTTHSRNSSVVSAPDIPEDPDDGRAGRRPRRAGHAGMCERRGCVTSREGGRSATL